MAEVIDYAETEPVDVVVEGPGWRQTTPVGRGGRYYEDVAPSCELEVDTNGRFASLTHTLRTCFPTDFTGPAKWNVARAAVDQRDEWITRPDDDARRWLVDQADVSLHAAGDRGSAVHRAVEALLEGAQVDMDDLVRNGAVDYLAAVEAFLIAAKPRPTLLETVAFNRWTGTACTLDYFGGLFDLDAVVVDWKTRTKNHDRRPKEAAQLGGIIDMASNGYYMDDRGHRAQATVDHSAIVTFAPDGTWAYHPVEVDTAVASWRAALAMRPHTLVSNVYGKARKGAPLDVVGIVTERLAAIPADSPEKMALAMAWREHGLPKVADLTLEDWRLADELLTRVEPFRTTPGEVVTYATTAEVTELFERIRALPSDLRAEVDRAGGGLGDLGNGLATVEVVEDWERLVTPAESAAAGRLFDVGIILGQLGAALVPSPYLPAVRTFFPNDFNDWTDADVDRCAEVVDAILDGDIISTAAGTLIVSPKVIESSPKLETRMKAAEVARTIGRPVPTKFSDVMSDPVLFAATRSMVTA